MFLFFAFSGYLLWLPFVRAARTGRQVDMARCAILLAAGAASLVLWLTLVTFATHRDLRWQYSLPTTFFYFVPGMLLAHWRAAWPPERGAPRGPVGSSDAWLLASVPIWLLACWRFDLTPLTAAASMLVVGSCVLPLRDGRLASALAWRPIAAVGIASYSLYLWHFPIVRALHVASWAPKGFAPALVIGATLSLMAAAASYLALERPFLLMRGRWATTEVASRARKGPETSQRP